MSAEVRALEYFEIAQAERAEYDLAFTRPDGTPEPMAGDRVAVEFSLGPEIVLRKQTPLASGIDNAQASQGKFVLHVFPKDFPPVDARRELRARVTRVKAADLPANPSYVRVIAEGPVVLLPSPRTDT